jgi:hypothetical protein
MTARKGSDAPLVDFDVEAENFSQYSIRIMGMTTTQIRGLREFYSRLTGADFWDLPEIGAMRRMADLIEPHVPPSLKSLTKE